jgi:hypothetical protein
MPDSRTHRGPHPQDAQLFGSDQLETLQRATHDMIWLLSQEYNQQAALTLVGNRFQLQKRQRSAVMRASCSNLRAATRRNRRIQVIGQSIAVDAFNLIITLEAARNH